MSQARSSGIGDASSGALIRWMSHGPMKALYAHIYIYIYIYKNCSLQLFHYFVPASGSFQMTSGVLFTRAVYLEYRAQETNGIRQHARLLVGCGRQALGGGEGVIDYRPV